MNYNTQIGVKALLLALLTVFVVGVVWAVNAIEPSAPQNVDYRSSDTNDYPNGTKLNYSRGSIHTVNLDETQPTLKWVGYVGNVTGRFALQDSGGFALYDWSLATTTGEVYATKEGPLNTANNDGVEGGGIPDWENMVCANPANMTLEEKLWNHTTSYGAQTDEDSLLYTFKAHGSGWTASKDFYIGEEAYVTSGSSSDSENCYGIHLNRNDTAQSSVWQEVVMMDGTFETEVAVEGTTQQWDLVYVSVIENNTAGYRNGSIHDWQMLLPQSGLEGSTIPNIAYYFYIELI